MITEATVLGYRPEFPKGKRRGGYGHGQSGSNTPPTLKKKLILSRKIKDQVLHSFRTLLKSELSAEEQTKHLKKLVSVLEKASGKDHQQILENDSFGLQVDYLLLNLNKRLFLPNQLVLTIFPDSTGKYEIKENRITGSWKELNGYGNEKIYLAPCSTPATGDVRTDTNQGIALGRYAVVDPRIKELTASTYQSYIHSEAAAAFNMQKPNPFFGPLKLLAKKQEISEDLFAEVCGYERLKHEELAHARDNLFLELSDQTFQTSGLLSAHSTLPETIKHLTKGAAPEGLIEKTTKEYCGQLGGLIAAMTELSDLEQYTESLLLFYYFAQTAFDSISFLGLDNSALEYSISNLIFIEDLRSFSEKRSSNLTNEIYDNIVKPVDSAKDHKTGAETAIGFLKEIYARNFLIYEQRLDLVSKD